MSVSVSGPIRGQICQSSCHACLLVYLVVFFAWARSYVSARRIKLPEDREDKKGGAMKMRGREKGQRQRQNGVLGSGTQFYV